MIETGVMLIAAALLLSAGAGASWMAFDGYRKDCEPKVMLGVIGAAVGWLVGLLVLGLAAARLDAYFGTEVPALRPPQEAKSCPT
jgi:hypothetical protein